MKTPELGWRGKGQVSHCGASGVDKWVFAQPCPPGLQANQDPLVDLCGPQPGGWVLSPSNKTGSQPCPCFLLLWVGQAGSWLCGVPGPQEALETGQVRLEFFQAGTGGVGGESNYSVHLMHPSAHGGL